MENRPIPDLYGFTNHMSRGESIAAAIYLPIHAVGLPLGLAWLAGFIPALAQLSDTELNMLYYGLGLVYVLIALRGFLRRSFDVALDHKGRLLLGALGGYAVNIGASFVISALLLIFGLELGMSPNNQAIMTEAAVDYRRMAVMVIVMAPVVEEPLFRGLLFGCIRPRSRVWAYVVSCLLFSLYHVWQYVLIYGDWRMLIYCLLYLPASIGLAWAYDRSGSIWGAIILHGMVNGISLSVLSSGLLGY